ncbi:MAG: CRISPR-associated protein Cas4 [Treponema sp.]|nr:CRISPR-associated protein Cas4 [Treponema sp.]
MYQESDYLLLSGLQHLCCCPRQCAFIHIEQVWSENFFTASGRVLHEKVHGGVGESRRCIRIERDLKISSSNLGVTGKTDAVEFYSDGTIIPIEYKHGKPKDDVSDEVQLCAQVMCLEEMLNVNISTGALFYFKIRKRVSVDISTMLRQKTIQVAKEFHSLVQEGKTPPAHYTKKCNSCSFMDSCFPESAGRHKSVETYIKRLLMNTTSSVEGEF